MHFLKNTFMNPADMELHYKCIIYSYYIIIITIRSITIIIVVVVATNLVMHTLVNVPALQCYCS